MLNRLILQLEDLFAGRPSFGEFGDRSPAWRKVRSIWLKDNPCCAVCGCATNLNVHHIVPFHVSPELELDPNNLITLGEYCPTGNHHFLFGHLGDWRSWNPQVRGVSIEMRSLILNRPYKEKNHVESNAGYSWWSW